MRKGGTPEQMSFRKPCAKTLDRPIVVFGLEPEELVLVGLVAGAILFLVDPVPAVGAGGALWLGLSRVKAGKPPGHLFELLHRSGLLRWAPDFFRAPQLLRPGRRTLDAFPGGNDDEIREYRSGRPRLDP
jgi:type IV secretory pathway TrbD component